MTSEQNNFEKDAVEELTSKWFDSEEMVSKSVEETLKSINARQAQQISELQLVNSLLLQLADKNEAAREHRIENLMQKIDSGNQATHKYNRIIRPLVRYAVAAVIIIAAAIIFMKSPSNTAMAAFNKMITAIDNAADRTYAIRVVEGKRDDRQPPPRNPEIKKEPGERAMLDGSTLYLRGRDKFVLYQKTPSGRTVVSGSDGQTRWHIRPDKPVLVSNNPEAFRVPMPPELAAILSMDLKETMLHIRDHYKIKYLEDIPDEQGRDNSRTYLDAAKIRRDFPGPQNIELWADSNTGLLLRIEFADIHLEGDPSGKRLIIELVNQDRLSDDWFTRQAHHPKDAEVDSVSYQ